MIVPLQKITLIMPKGDRFKAVGELRDLGVMHVEEVALPDDGGERSVLEERVAEAARLTGVLEQIRPDNSSRSKLAGEALLEAVRDTLKNRTELARTIEQKKQQMQILSRWGDFDPAQIKELEARGVYLYLCMAPPSEYRKLCDAGFVCRELSESGSNPCRFAVIMDRKMSAEDKLPAVTLPENTSLSQLQQELAGLEAAAEKAEKSLRSFAAALPELKHFKLALEEMLEFAVVRDSALENGALAAITGFVPESACSMVGDFAKSQGWGIYSRSPDPVKDNVPTLLKQSRIARLINPLLDFLSITPAYNEKDVSISVLIFFTVFFGLLIGDAGYGLVFLIISGSMLAAKRNNRTLRLPLALLVLLSSAAVAWGAMTSNWFGMPLLPGIPALADSPEKDRNTQLVCFSLAMIQLALAHGLRIISGGWKIRNIIGNTGWILVLAGNFMLVVNLLIFPGTVPPAVLIGTFVSGVLLAAAGDVDWSDAGSIFGFPFGIIGSFVDILSYIRLFAVGLSGYYLAVCFNGMAQPMFESPATFVFGLFIVLVGHLLNIALAVMSVLVHGVRLNTLEFSSHLGLTWGGFAFSPFRKKINDSIQITNQGEK